MLTHNKIYDVISIEKDWYRIIDDSGEATWVIWNCES